MSPTAPNVWPLVAIQVLPATHPPWVVTEQAPVVLTQQYPVAPHGLGEQVLVAAFRRARS